MFYTYCKICKNIIYMRCNGNVFHYVTSSRVEVMLDITSALFGLDS